MFRTCNYYMVLLVFFLSPFSVLSKEQCVLPSNISEKIKLDRDCVYVGGITIKNSHTELDCNYSTIKSSGFKDGIIISSEGKNLSNVVVKNCIIQNARESGIRIAWRGSDISKSGQPERYRRTPHNIIIENCEIINSGKNGIFIDDYSSYVTVKNSIVKGSGSTAVYIEHDSKNNTIENNLFEGNGYNNQRPVREALAVDSSQKNTIVGNTFKNNGLGGVFLYKNCSERIHSGTQEIREMHTNFNIIRNNLFQKEKVGVWLASRQSKNLKHMDCGDEPIESTHSYFKDYADHNDVYDNFFLEVNKPLIDEGKSNRIFNNSILN